MSPGKKIVEIKIPPRLKIEEALLQINLEKLADQIVAITILKREYVPQDSTQLVDVSAVLEAFGVFLKYESF